MELASIPNSVKGPSPYPICYTKCQIDVFDLIHPPTPENVRCDQKNFFM